jgi:hypothetical protein
MRFDYVECFLGVMAGLVPAIHVLLAEAPARKTVDARDKRGHDDGEVVQSHRELLFKSCQHQGDTS